TIREDDGLAMSSRNKRLTAESRQVATALYKALTQAGKELKQKPVSVIRNEVISQLNGVNLINVEYFDIVETDSLQPVQDVTGLDEVALCIAAFVGDVRLI